MRHILTLDNTLDNLGHELDYWRWKYETAHPFIKAEYYNDYQKAKKAFADYYSKKYPKQASKVKKPSDYIMLADRTERFEEYGD